MKLTKSKLKQIIKEELGKILGEDIEKSSEELACEKQAENTGEPYVFNTNTGKCELAN